MRWIVKFKDGECYMSESMVETNKKLMDKGHMLSTIDLKVVDRLFKFDFDTGNIFLAAELIYENQLPGPYRWISFREVTAQAYTISPPEIIDRVYHIGWQTNVRDEKEEMKNIKVLVKVDEMGNFTLSAE
jgi:hypothetical protein